MKLAAVRAVDLIFHRPDSLSLSAVWLSTGKKNANCPQEQLSIAIWSEVPEADEGSHPHCHKAELQLGVISSNRGQTGTVFKRTKEKKKAI